MLSALFFDIASLGLPAEIQIVPWALALIWAIYGLEVAGITQMPRIDVRGNPMTVVTSGLGHFHLLHIGSNSLGLVIMLSTYMIMVDDPWLGLVVMYLGPSSLIWLAWPKDHNIGRGLSDFLYAMNGWFVFCALDLSRTAYYSPIIFIVAMVFLAISIKGSLPGEHNKGVAWDAHMAGLVVGLAWGAYYYGYLDVWIERYL